MYKHYSASRNWYRYVAVLRSTWSVSSLRAKDTIPFHLYAQHYYIATKFFRLKWPEMNFEFFYSLEIDTDDGVTEDIINI